MKLNQPVSHRIHTHQGAPAARITPYQELRRSVLSCMLFEKEFYESGQAIHDRIRELAGMVSAKELGELAIEARTEFNLRHVSLLLAVEYADRYAGGKIPGPGAAPAVAHVINRTIQRADELCEFVAAWWSRKPPKAQSGRHVKQAPLPKQVKKGLAAAFVKFDPYQLAKYDQKGTPVKLRDVLRLCHAKPGGEGQAAVWRKLIDGKLDPPDTWETALITESERAVREAVGLSREQWRDLSIQARKEYRNTHMHHIAAAKREEYERLLKENRLGYMALLRNLRNMDNVRVNPDLIRGAIRARLGARRVLPFRYVAAARAAPRFEPELDEALVASIGEAEPLPGRTVVLVDVSDSMNWAPISANSDLLRMEAAATLAAVVPAENLRVFSFSADLVEIPPRRGMAGVDAVIRSQEHAGTWLGAAVQHLGKNVEYDRLIVITDEQSHDPVPAPRGRGYMINVASAQNGVGYGNWIHVDGFSERVIRWIQELEGSQLA